MHTNTHKHTHALKFAHMYTFAWHPHRYL